MSVRFRAATASLHRVLLGNSSLGVSAATFRPAQHCVSTPLNTITPAAHGTVLRVSGPRCVRASRRQQRHGERGTLCDAISQREGSPSNALRRR